MRLPYWIGFFHVQRQLIHFLHVTHLRQEMQKSDWGRFGGSWPSIPWARMLSSSSFSSLTSSADRPEGEVSTEGGSPTKDTAIRFLSNGDDFRLDVCPGPRHGKAHGREFGWSLALVKTMLPSLLTRKQIAVELVT